MRFHKGQKKPLGIPGGFLDALKRSATAHEAFSFEQQKHAKHDSRFRRQENIDDNGLCGRNFMKLTTASNPRICWDKMRAPRAVHETSILSLVPYRVVVSAIKSKFLAA